MNHLVLAHAPALICSNSVLNIHEPPTGSITSTPFLDGMLSLGHAAIPKVLLGSPMACLYPFIYLGGERLKCGIKFSCLRKQHNGRVMRYMGSLIKGMGSGITAQGSGIMHIQPWDQGSQARFLRNEESGCTIFVGSSGTKICHTFGIKNQKF